MNDNQLIGRIVAIWVDGGGDVLGFEMCYAKILQGIKDVKELEEIEKIAEVNNDNHNG